MDTFVRPFKNGLLGVVAHVVDPAAGTPPPATVVMTAPAHALGKGDGETDGDGDCDAPPGDTATEDDAEVDADALRLTDNGDERNETVVDGDTESPGVSDGDWLRSSVGDGSALAEGPATWHVNTRRIRWFELSATNTEPARSAARLLSEPNLAEAPTPSEYPQVSLPARNCVTPVATDVMLRRQNEISI